MCPAITLSEEILKKQKYFEKTLSEDALWIMYLRMFDIEPLFARLVWLQITPFDLSQLGLGLLYWIIPADFKPLMLGFTFELPSLDELMQGIWMNFEPIKFEELYPWLLDLQDYIKENIKEEYQPPLLEKARYNMSLYGRGYYDPFLPREFMSGTFHRLRLMRTPDVSWKSMMEQIAKMLEMTGVTDKHVYNRIMMHFSAQTQSFVLGLSTLGISKLSEMDEDSAVIPFIDAEGNIHNLKFRTLDHLQIGLILGVTPLGYGILLPKNSIYKLPEGKKNPPFIAMLLEKTRKIIHSLPLTPWAFGNYNKPEEMRDYHKSERTSQYHALHEQRRWVENWVASQIPSEEANPVKTRQYQNAVLQAISWKSKRHKWGFKVWEHMTEDQFYEWWLNYWESNGLNRQTLIKLHEGMKTWMSRLRRDKLNLGEKVKLTRRQLALSP